MIDPNRVDEMIGAALIAGDRRRVGVVTDVLRDDVNNWPTWAVVRLDDSERAVPVPLSDAELAEDGVVVPYPGARIGAAPSLAREGHLNPDEQTETYRHYELQQPAEVEHSRDPHLGSRMKDL